MNPSHEEKRPRLAKKTPSNRCTTQTAPLPCRAVCTGGAKDPAPVTLPRRSIPTDPASSTWLSVATGSLNLVDCVKWPGVPVEQSVSCIRSEVLLDLLSWSR